MATRVFLYWIMKTFEIQFEGRCVIKKFSQLPIPVCKVEVLPRNAVLGNLTSRWLRTTPTQDFLAIAINVLFFWKQVSQDTHAHFRLFIPNFLARVNKGLRDWNVETSPGASSSGTSPASSSSDPSWSTFPVPSCAREKVVLKNAGVPNLSNQVASMC